MKERHSSGEKLDESDSEEDRALQKKEAESEAKEAKETKGDASKLSTVSSEIISASTRMLKRAVEHSKYQQLIVDADSDEKENGDNEDLKPPRPQADSSSEGQDGTERGDRYYKKDRDFGYQELDDEFGRKYSAKPSPDFHQYNTMDYTSDQGESQSEEADRRPSLISKVAGAKSQNQQGQLHDRIVGHAHGGRPLLDDDELSDSETPKEPVPSRGSSAMSGGSSALMSLGTPTTSPMSAQSEGSNPDPFSGAPFKKKDSRKKRPSVKSPPQKVNLDDPFAKAPFRSGSAGLAKTKSPPKSGTPTMYVNQAVVMVDQDDPFVFLNARGGSAMSSTISPASVEMRSPSQSPGVAQPVNIAQQPTAPTTRDIPVQGLYSANTSTSPPSLSSSQNDVFGLQSFAHMTPYQMQQQMGRRQLNQHTPQPVPPQQAACYSPPQSQPPPATHLSTSPSDHLSIGSPKSLQGEDLFGARPFEDAMFSDYQPDAHRPPPADNKHMAGGAKKTLRKNSGNRVRRRGSSGSSGSEGKPSPRSSKKDKYFSRSTELLHDENMEVLLDSPTQGSAKKGKHKPSKKASKDSTAFSNLSFMDDSEKDPDMLESRSESQMNLASDTALKTSNAANYAEEGSHTLPRAGSKKHRVLPKTPDAEPFTVKKKSGGKIFK